MRERPILFNADMVRAVLYGRKTQTRRIMKVQPHAGVRNSPFVKSGIEDGHGKELVCPFGEVGDCLWVRETWSDVNLEGVSAVAYRADQALRCMTNDNDDGDEDDPRLEKYSFANWYPDLISGTEGIWRPSIHMPRWASRITLEITGVRVERLQDINHDDSYAEGIHTEVWDQTVVAKNYCESDSFFQFWSEDMDHYVEMDELYRQSFGSLWQSIYGEESWQANPWVWVIEFRRIEVRP